MVCAYIVDTTDKQDFYNAHQIILDNTWPTCMLTQTQNTNILADEYSVLKETLYTHRVLRIPQVMYGIGIVFYLLQGNIRCPCFNSSMNFGMHELQTHRIDTWEHLCNYVSRIHGTMRDFIHGVNTFLLANNYTHHSAFNTLIADVRQFILAKIGNKIGLDDFLIDRRAFIDTFFKETYRHDYDPRLLRGHIVENLRMFLHSVYVVNGTKLLDQVLKFELETPANQARLWRGATTEFESVVDTDKQPSRSYSLSYNLSVLSSVLNDVQSCTYYFMIGRQQLKSTYLLDKFYRGDGTPNDSLFYVCPLHPCAQLFCGAILFHPRTKIGLDSDIMGVRTFSNDFDTAASVRHFPTDYMVSTRTVEELASVFRVFLKTREFFQTSTPHPTPTTRGTKRKRSGGRRSTTRRRKSSTMRCLRRAITRT